MGEGESYGEAKMKPKEWKGNQFGRRFGSQQREEGRKPPPLLDYSLLSTLKRARPSCGRATREELPPSPAGKGKQKTS